MGVIEVKHLTKDYGEGRGVFDVSFVVNKGEVFGFLGPNWTGKSTTIRHLMGFSKPQSGETLLLDEPTFDKYSFAQQSGIYSRRNRLVTGTNRLGVFTNDAGYENPPL